MGETIIKQGVILAAGLGKRLRPLTYFIPKPLVPVWGKPLLFWIVKWLKENKVKEIIITSFYRSSSIKKFADFYFEKKYDSSIHVIREDKLYGRAYALKRIEDLLDKNFIVIDGDTITNLNITEMYKFHKQKKSILTIATKQKIISKGGLIISNKSNRIIDFKETKLNNPELHLSNCGIYLFNKKALNFIKNKNDDISKNLIPELIEKTRRVYEFRLHNDTFWYEYGTLKKYIKFVLTSNKPIL